MAVDLTPPFDWTLVEGLFNEPLYDGASVAELFNVVGTPANAPDKAEAAAFRLSEIAKSFAFELWNEGQPRPDHEGAAAMRIAAACETILTLTGVGTEAEPSPDALLPSFGPGGLFAGAAMRDEPNGRAATMNALRAVYLLRCDALKMAEIRAKRSTMKPPKTGRKESSALRHLVANLTAFYFDVWAELPTVSRSKARETSQQLTGKFVRLLSEVNKTLLARGLKYYATEESLVAYWRSLEPDERHRLDMVKTPHRQP